MFTVPSGIPLHVNNITLYAPSVNNSCSFLNYFSIITCIGLSVYGIIHMWYVVAPHLGGIY